MRPPVFCAPYIRMLELNVNRVASALSLNIKLLPPERKLLQMPLGIIFIGIPIIELALLIRLGGWLGVFETILIVVITGLAGAVLARRQGFTALSRIRQNLEQGTPPGDEMLRGALILLAGFLLIFPGVLTDLAGLLLFVPPLRTRAANALKAFILSRVRRGDVRFYRLR